MSIAAMHLAKHVGAEIFATIGTKEMRAFVRDQFDIPDDYIFHYRTTEFTTALMKMTNRRGCDVILNSLTGDILTEFWPLYRGWRHDDRDWEERYSPPQWPSHGAVRPQSSI